MVARVVAYLYQGDYDCGAKSPPRIKARPWRDQMVDERAEEILHRMVANAAVCALANYLNIQDLKRLAMERFRTLAQQHWIE